MRGDVHFADQAAELVSLPVGAPARVEAHAHAGTCAACQLALREAADLWAFLGDLPPEPAPTAAVRRAIERPILAELASRAVPSGALTMILLASWGALLLMARHPVNTHGARFASLALLAVAVASVHLARRGGAIAAATVMAASLASAALMATRGPMGAAIGLHCALTEMAVAILPAIVLVRVFARRRSVGSARSFVAVVAAAALAGQAVLQRACPFQASRLHDLVFHFGGVALVALSAAALVSWRARRARGLSIPG